MIITNICLIIMCILLGLIVYYLYSIAINLRETAYLHSKIYADYMERKK